MDLGIAVTVPLCHPYGAVFGAGGPVQLCLQCSHGGGLHTSSGLRKAQAIRMTLPCITSKAKTV